MSIYLLKKDENKAIDFPSSGPGKTLCFLFILFPLNRSPQINAAAAQRWKKLAICFAGAACIASALSVDAATQCLSNPDIDAGNNTPQRPRSTPATGTTMVLCHPSHPRTLPCHSHNVSCDRGVCQGYNTGHCYSFGRGWVVL